MKDSITTSFSLIERSYEVLAKLRAVGLDEEAQYVEVLCQRVARAEREDRKRAIERERDREAMRAIDQLKRMELERDTLMRMMATVQDPKLP